jgi:O-succinylbenzoate synthase
MKIDRVEIREIRMRLREPFEGSTGASHGRRVLLVSLRSGGITGWGECVAGETPAYSYETTDTAWSILTDLILPRVSGAVIESSADLLPVFQGIRGHPMARAAVEMAVWDLEAKAGGGSLASLLGGVRASVPAGVSIGLQRTEEELHRKVADYIEEGYQRIKVKIKPGRDVAMLHGLRDRYPDVPFMADANSAYSLEDLPRLRELDALGLTMIEQPLAHDDYLDHARLQSEMTTPICLDESIRSIRDVALALEIGACRIINIKPGRVGGLSSAKAIHDLCVEHDTPVWCGGMLESGIGRAHNVALAALPGFTLPGDISASRRYWSEDIVTPEFTLDAGTISVPSALGIGVEVKEDLLAAWTVRKAEF